jgi:hypothetical protein
MTRVAEIQTEESLILPAVSWISVILAFAAVSLSWLVARLFHVRFKNRLAAVLRSSETIQKGSSSKLTVEDVMREEQEREYHRQQKLKASITPLSHSRINPLAKSTGMLLTGDGLASSFILPPHSSFSSSSTNNSATSSPASSVPSSPSTLRASSTGQGQGQVVTEDIQTKRKVAALVSSVRLFQFLEDPALRELAQLFTQRSIQKNEVLFGRTVDGKNEIPEHELVVVVSGCIHIVLDSISKPPPAPRRRPRRRSSLQMDPTAIATLLANVAAAASDTSSPPTSTEQHHIPPPPQPIRKQQMLSVQKPGRCVTSVHAMLEKMTIWSDEDEDDLSDDETTTTGGPSTSTSYANLNSTPNQDKDRDNTDEVDEVITAIAAGTPSSSYLLFLVNFFFLLTLSSSLQRTA